MSDLERVPLPDLLRAAAHGDLAAVEALLAGGANHEATDALGWTAMTAAAAGGHDAIVRTLAAAGASVTHRADDGWTPLEAAAFDGHATVIDVLIGLRAPLEARVVSLAAFRGHLDAVSALERHGARLSNLDRARWFRARLLRAGHRLRLGETAYFGGHDDNPYGDDPSDPTPEVQFVDGPMSLPDRDAALALVPTPCSGLTKVDVGGVVFRTEKSSTKGADGGSVLYLPAPEIITARLAPHLHGLSRLSDEERAELLSLAALDGLVQVVRVLLRDTDAGPRALTWAAARGHVEIVRLLLDAGAVAHASDALLRACANGHLDAVRILLDAGAKDDGALLEASYAPRLETMRFLLERGARTDFEGHYGSTPMLAVAGGGHVDALKLLLARGADVDGRNRQGDAPLMRAARAEHADAVRVLLDAHASVDLRDADGLTALMHTVARRDYPNVRRTARMLLDAGASTEIADEKGWTALVHAIHAPCVEMVDLLVSRGADRSARDKAGKTVDDHARSSVYPREIEAILRRP